MAIILPWENSREIESGNKGERFGAAGGKKREGKRLRGRAPFSRLWRPLARVARFFVRGEDSPDASDFEGTDLFSRNLGCNSLKQRRQTDSRSECSCRSPGHFADSFQSLFLLSLSLFRHPLQKTAAPRRRPHKHLIKATRLRDHHSCCAFVRTFVLWCGERISKVASIYDARKFSVYITPPIACIWNCFTLQKSCNLFYFI